MTRRLIFLGLLGLLLSATGCKTDQQAVTMAVINSRDVVTKCNDGIRVSEEIQREFADRRNDLKSQEDAIHKLQADPALSDPKSGKKTELQRLVQAYLEAGQQLRKDVSAEEALKFKPVLDKVNKVLAEYAKTHGLLGIQDKNGFAYIDPSIDITTEIIKQVDQAK